MEKPEFILEAERKADELFGSLVEQGIQAIDALIEEVESAEFATRFNRAATSQDMELRVQRVGHSLSAIARDAVEKEGEAGYKKAQLIADLGQMKQKLLDFQANARTVVADFEMSKMEG